MRTRELIREINNSNGKAVKAVVRINRAADDKCFSFFCNEEPFTNIFKAMGYFVNDGEILFPCDSDAEGHVLLMQAYSSLSIPDVAEKAANCAIVTEEVGKMKPSETYLEYVIRRITEEQGKNVYAIVTSVARSGMSRRIKVYMLDNELHEITGLLGGSQNTNGLLVKGCGMDMCFKSIYDFNAKYMPYPQALECANNYRSLSICLVEGRRFHRAR